MFFKRHFNAFILPAVFRYISEFNIFYGEIFAILCLKMSQSVIIGKFSRSP